MLSISVNDVSGLGLFSIAALRFRTRVAQASTYASGADEFKDS